MIKATDQPRIHIEHLIAALALIENSILTQRLARHGMRYYNDVRQAMAAGKKGLRIPDVNSYQEVNLDELPPMSDNALQALRHAQAIADQTSSQEIDTPHLLYGALSVTESGVVRALLEKGLTREELSLGDTPVQATTEQTQSRPRPSGAASRAAGGTPIFASASDQPEGNDLLNLEAEVDALAALVASADTKTPLSIGLFGDWGSGKSFFMRKMDERIRVFRDDARLAGQDPSPFCPNVVQLWFNAWHYIDKSLWASLGAEIFEGLADSFAEDGANAPGRDRLEAERTSLSLRHAAAEAERAHAAEAHDRSTKVLRDAQNRSMAISSRTDLDIQRSLGVRAVSSELVAAVTEDTQIRDELNRAAERLGVPKLEAAGNELERQVKELVAIGGFGKSLVAAIRARATVWWMWVLVAGLVIAAVPLTRWVLSYADQMQPLLARLITVLSAVAAASAPFVAVATRVANVMRDARGRIAKRVGDERKKEVAEADQVSAAAASAVTVTAEALVSAERRVAQAREELAKLEPMRQLADFIKARNKSDEYTKHFGVIARARRDFEELTRLMTLVKAEQGKAAVADALALPHIDRIVLYIDDLDRCPEDKVFEVLQAVHLLLAFPLFVVIVGVDPRWLLLSLRRQLRAFAEVSNGDEDDDDEDDERKHWEATPLNYLEKIFQLPFTLRPMGDKGFANLIDDLTVPKAPATAEGAGPRVRAAVPGAAAQPPADGRSPAPASGSPQPPVQTAPAAQQQGQQQPPPPAPSGETGSPVVTPALPTPAPVPAAQPLRLAHERLELRDWERTYMKLMFPLIPSPRAAKRFVNVYRVLRAITLGQRRLDLIGNADGGGYRTVLFLLAMMTRYPVLTAELIDDLFSQRRLAKAPAGWWEFVEAQRRKYDESVDRPDAEKKKQTRANAPADRRGRDVGENDEPSKRGPNDDRVDVEQWQEFFGTIVRLRANVGENLATETVVDWATDVVRYSFASGRLLVSTGGTVAGRAAPRA